MSVQGSDYGRASPSAWRRVDDAHSVIQGVNITGLEWHPEPALAGEHPPSIYYMPPPLHQGQLQAWLDGHLFSVWYVMHGDKKVVFAADDEIRKYYIYFVLAESAGSE